MTCGKGSHSRNRYCSGAGCAGDKEETAECEQSSSCLPTTGKYYEWSDWSTCSQTCNGGTQSRTRQCSTATCAGASSESTSCNNQICGNDIQADDPSNDALYNEKIMQISAGLWCCLVFKGQWSQWNEWSQCSRTCGKGSQFRYRGCRRGSCAGEKSEERSCYVTLCAQWGGWSWWSNCDAGRTLQKRIRNCYGSGDCVGEKHETKPC